MPSKLIPRRAREENSIERPMPEKAKWNELTTEPFLTVCVEEIATRNRPHAHFNKEGWKNIIAKFNKNIGHNYDKK